MSDEKDQPNDVQSRRALIEVITENGFFIARLSDEKVRDPAPYQFSFIVRAPDEEERNVEVGFDDEAIILIQKRRRIPLTRDSLYWVNGAERSLAAYLAEKNHLPPGGKLLIEELRLDEIEAARRWDAGLRPYVEMNLRSRVRANILGTGFYLQSIFVVLFLYLIAAVTPKILAPNLMFLRDSLSSFILYAAIFLSGTLLGLCLMDLMPATAFLKMPEMKEYNVNHPPSFDEKGLTPVERVIREENV